MKQIETHVLARAVALLCVTCMVCAGCGGRENGDNQQEGQSAAQDQTEDKGQSREGTQEESVSAVTMSLVKTQGTVGVQDDARKEVELQEPLSLYNGYGIQTRTDSYAWINLDDTKLAKVDQESDVSVKKEGKHLEMVCESEGGLFFHVTEALEEEESLDIRMWAVSVGIRGTSGWVSQGTTGDRMTMDVYVLDGTVVCTVEGSEPEEVPVSAGHGIRVTFNEEGDPVWQSRGFDRDTIPEYVWVELDESMQEEVMATLSGANGAGADTGADQQEEVDPETLDPEAKVEYYLEFMEDGRERVFQDNITFFGQEIDTVTLENMRDVLVEQGLAESRLFLEEIEGLGTQLMYSGDMYAFMDLPVDGVQSPGATAFTTFCWIKEFPKGTSTGILDIQAGDSIETVLQKMGFTHAAEIGAVLRENTDIRVRWSSYDRNKDSWSVADLQEGAKVSDDISLRFGVWPGNQYAESEAFMELALSTMYKKGENSAGNLGNLSLYFNENYELYSMAMSQIQD